MDKKPYIIGILIILVIGTVMYIFGFSLFKLHLYFLKAGKADSCLITYNDKTILIDTGEEDFYDKLDSFLQDRKVNKIDYLIITHFDKDHVGSAAKIIDKYEIGNIYQTNTTKDSDEYNNYIISITNKNITPITVENDLKIDIDKLELVINGPDKLYEKDTSNNSSLIVSIKYKGKSFLLMGDAQEDRIKDYLSTHKNKYDLVKIPYHGNYQDQDRLLLDKVKPKYAIVSSDKIDNKLKKLLEEKKIEYYLTDDSNYDVGSDFNIKIYKI